MPKKTTKQLIRCERGDGERNGYCTCHGAKWKAQRVASEEDLSTLPPDDPHYVYPRIFVNRRKRKTIKMGYIAHPDTGAPLGKQLTLDDYLQ